MKSNKINELIGALDFLSIKELAVEELKKALQLKKALKSKVEEIKELQLEVLRKHDVQETNGTYEFATHPKRKEVEVDLKIVNEAEYEISPLNFIAFEKIKSNNAPNSFLSSDSLALLETLTDYLAIK